MVNYKLSQPACFQLARPLIGEYISLINRDIPAIPIADNSAPIVVGAKHTSKATNTVTEEGLSIPACLAPKAEYA